MASKSQVIEIKRAISKKNYFKITINNKQGELVDIKFIYKFKDWIVVTDRRTIFFINSREFNSLMEVIYELKLEVFALLSKNSHKNIEFKSSCHNKQLICYLKELLNTN